jgi:hypothetical protein
VPKDSADYQFSYQVSITTSFRLRRGRHSRRKHCERFARNHLWRSFDCDWKLEDPVGPFFPPLGVIVAQASGTQARVEFCPVSSVVVARRVHHWNEVYRRGLSWKLCCSRYPFLSGFLGSTISCFSKNSSFPLKRIPAGVPRKLQVPFLDSSCVPKAHQGQIWHSSP